MGDPAIERARVERRRLVRRVPQRHDGPVRRHAAERRREARTAGGLEDQIERGPLGFEPDHHFVGPELAEPLFAFGAADHGRDPGASFVRELDGEPADPPAAPVIATLDPSSGRRARARRARSGRRPGASTPSRTRPRPRFGDCPERTSTCSAHPPPSTDASTRRPGAARAVGRRLGDHARHVHLDATVLGGEQGRAIAVVQRVANLDDRDGVGRRGILRLARTMSAGRAGAATQRRIR